jgi:hypothetical protein
LLLGAAGAHVSRGALFGCAFGGGGGRLVNLRRLVGLRVQKLRLVLVVQL